MPILLLNRKLYIKHLLTLMRRVDIYAEGEYI